MAQNALVNSVNLPNIEKTMYDDNSVAVADRTIYVTLELYDGDSAVLQMEHSVTPVGSIPFSLDGVGAEMIKDGSEASELLLDIAMNGDKGTSVVSFVALDMASSYQIIVNHSYNDVLNYYFERDTVQFDQPTWQALINGAATSVEQSVKNIELLAYPNPASNFIAMNGLNAESAEIAIYSLLGQKALTSDVAADRIDVSGLQAGQYLLHVLSKDGTVQASRQIAIQR